MYRENLVKNRELLKNKKIIPLGWTFSDYSACV